MESLEQDLETARTHFNSAHSLQKSESLSNKDSVGIMGIGVTVGHIIL